MNGIKTRFVQVLIISALVILLLPVQALAGFVLQAGQIHFKTDEKGIPHTKENVKVTGNGISGTLQAGAEVVLDSGQFLILKGTIITKDGRKINYLNDKPVATPVAKKKQPVKKVNPKSVKKTAKLKPVGSSIKTNKPDTVLQISVSPVKQTSIPAAQTFNTQDLADACVQVYVNKNGNAVERGSGVFLDYGRILTCKHVTDAGDTYSVIFNQSSEPTGARMFKTVPAQDACLLESANKTIKPVKIGDSDIVKIGDRVILISTPKGAKNTVSYGEVKGRSVVGEINGIVVSNLSDVGSSGGALFNDKGELIGILKAGDAALKVSLIIPINDIRKGLEVSGGNNTEDKNEVIQNIQSNGDKYVGQFRDGKKNGQGTLIFADGRKYVGQFKDNLKNGQGTFEWPNGQKYVGQFKDDLMNGQGTYTWPDGEKYVGLFKDDLRNGQGTYTWLDGRKYVGQFKDDLRNGQGTFTWPDGRKYVGQFKDDNPTGEGTVFLSDGSVGTMAYIKNEFIY